MSENKNTPYALVATFSAVVFLVSIIAFLLFQNTSALSFMAESNVVLYICALATFAIAFFVFYVIFSHLPALCGRFNRFLGKQMNPRMASTLFCIGVLCLAGLLLHRRFVAEWSEYAIDFYAASIHDFPVWAGILIYAVIGIVTLIMAFSKRDVPSWTVWPLCILFAALCFMSTLTIDICAADTHHGVAYLESIYNVYYGTPYNADTTGVYGHYGLFYGLLLRLLNKDVVTINCMIAGVAAVVSLGCSYILQNTVKKNWLKILGTFACGFTVVTSRVTNYYQVQPHRVIFPILVLSILVWQVKKNRWSWSQRILDYILVALSILWNTESGLFCMVAVTGALVVHDWQEESWISRKAFIRYFVYIIACLLSLLAAMGTVMIYNRMCFWYDFDVRAFFAPLLTSDYMNGVLRADMQIRNSAWVYVLLLFAGVLLAALRHTSLFESKSERKETEIRPWAPVWTALAFLGLLNFSYYANRAAYYNLDIILQLAVLALCMVADRNLPRLYNVAKGCSVDGIGHGIVSACCAMTVVVLGVQSILFAPALLQKKYANGHWSTKNIDTICAEIEQNVPKDTYAFGYALTIYYQRMGWDTQAHYTDFSDITAFGLETPNKMVEEAVAHGSFLVMTADSEWLVQKALAADPSFQLVWSSDAANYPIQYWCKAN